jgi:hypothetical protein
MPVDFGVAARRPSPFLSSSAISHVAELVQAMEDEHINQHQFEHATKTIRQPMLAVLTAATQSGTPWAQAFGVFVGNRALEEGSVRSTR